MKKSVCMILAAAALTGCTSSDLTEKTPVNPGEVSIALKSAHIGIEASTRKPYEGTISADNALVARVITSDTQGSGYAQDEYYANGVMVFENPSAVTMYNLDYDFQGNIKFPVESEPTDKYYFCGLYPHNVWTVGSSAAEATITGNADLMVAKEIATTPGDIADQKMPPLAFQHLLTKLNISLVTGTDFASVYWGEIQSIKLTKVLTQSPANAATVNLATGVLTTDGGGSAPKICGIDADGVYLDTEYVAQALSAEANGTKAVGYSMIAPFKSGTKTDLTFEVLTQHNGAKTVTVELPAKATTSGLAFDVTFTFKGSDDLILGAATVTEWKYGGSGNADLE